MLYFPALQRFFCLKAYKLRHAKTDLCDNLNANCGFTKNLQPCNASGLFFVVSSPGPPCKIRVSIHVLSMVPIKEIDMVSISNADWLVNTAIYFSPFLTTRECSQERRKHLNA